MSDTPFGDDLAEEASNFLQGQGLVDHLHAQYHEHEKKLYDITEEHGWTPKGIRLQEAHRRKGHFIAGALKAAIGGEFYKDGTGCLLCGHRDPRAYEGPERTNHGPIVFDSGSCNIINLDDYSENREDDSDTEDGN